MVDRYKHMLPIHPVATVDGHTTQKLKKEPVLLKQGEPGTSQYVTILVTYPVATGGWWRPSSSGYWSLVYRLGDYYFTRVFMECSDQY